MSLNPVQNQPTTLAGAGNSIADTTLVLSALLAVDGVTHLTMANFGTKGYATIEPGNGTQEEQISFTGITNNANGTDTLTGVSTVLFITPYTETSGMAKTHPGGAQFVISNTAGFYNHFAVLDDAETITGTWTFNTPPISATDPTGSTQVANKHYVDGVAVSGAPNASPTVKGIVQEATQAQVDAKTGAGSTGADLYINPPTLRSTLLSDYVADTGAANAYVITPSPVITAYTAGMRFTFQAAHANTGASTIAVNGLAAKNITKLYNTALVANDILANQVIEIEYDGTEFQMMSPSGKDFVDLATNQTIAAGTKIFTVMPQSAAVPATGNDLTNKTYVDANINKLTNGVNPGNTTWSDSDTNERTWFSISIPANTLGTGNAVRLRGILSSYNFGASTATKRFKLKYGSTTIFDSTALAQTNSNSTKTGYVEIILMGNGATNSQAGSLQIMGFPNSLQADQTAFINLTGNGTSAEDSTTTLNLLLTVQDGAGASTGSMVITDYVVEKIH